MYPEKWRETCDPFSLPYKQFRPTKILGYPHAGNDVFHAEGVLCGEKVTAFVKAVRFYMAQCLVWFLQFSADDADYREYALSEIQRLCG